MPMCPGRGVEMLPSPFCDGWGTELKLNLTILRIPVEDGFALRGEQENEVTVASGPEDAHWTEID